MVALPEVSSLTSSPTKPSCQGNKASPNSSPTRKHGSHLCSHQHPPHTQASSVATCALQREELAWDIHICHLIAIPSSLEEKPWPDCPEIQSYWWKHQPSCSGRSPTCGHHWVFNSPLCFWLSSACNDDITKTLSFSQKKWLLKGLWHLSPPSILRRRCQEVPMPRGTPIAALPAARIHQP